LSPAVTSRVEATSGPTPLDGQELRRPGHGQPADALLAPADLVIEVSDAPGEFAQAQPDNRGEAVIISADAESRAGGEQVCPGQAAEPGADGVRRGHHKIAQLVQRHGACLVRAALDQLQRPPGLYRAIV
jgi:hypothetical protein